MKNLIYFFYFLMTTRVFGIDVCCSSNVKLGKLPSLEQCKAR